VIRALAAVSLVLLVSLGVNVHQFASARVAAAVAPLEQTITTLQATARESDAVREARVESERTIAVLQAQLAEAQNDVEVRYVTRIRELPAPACAPTRARVDAWNEIAL
jgi:hypothetical protein